MKKIYYVDPEHPTRCIQEYNVDIFEGPKRVWAILPDKTRSLLGTSSFFTLVAAQRAQRGYCEKIAKSSYMAYYHHHTWERAKKITQTLH